MPFGVYVQREPLVTFPVFDMYPLPIPLRGIDLVAQKSNLFRTFLVLHSNLLHRGGQK